MCDSVDGFKEAGVVDVPVHGLAHAHVIVSEDALDDAGPHEEEQEDASGGEKEVAASEGERTRSDEVHITEEKEKREEGASGNSRCGLMELRGSPCWRGPRGYGELGGGAAGDGGNEAAEPVSEVQSHEANDQEESSGDNHEEEILLVTVCAH